MHSSPGRAQADVPDFALVRSFSPRLFSLLTLSRRPKLLDLNGFQITSEVISQLKKAPWAHQNRLRTGIPPF